MPDACSVCEQKSELNHLEWSRIRTCTVTRLGCYSDGIISLILMLRVLNPWFSQYDDCDLLATKA